MKPEPHALGRLERQLGGLLAGGVTVSALLLAIGLGCWLWRPGGSASQTLLTAGLLVLMATPILRVGVSLVEYVRIRDWFFAATTVVVLVELAITVLVALSRNR